MNLLVFILYKFQRFFISLLLKTYSYKVAKKGEKLQELHSEVNYETENYRILLKNARAWSDEYNRVSTELLSNNQKRLFK